MAEMTGAQIVSGARLLAQDTDADEYNQGLSNTEWVSITNEAYYDFYVEANKGKVQWLFPVATAAYDGVNAYAHKRIESVAGLYEIQSLFLTNPREGDGVMLESMDPAEILYLQQRRPTTGTPKRAGWLIEEGSRRFVIYVWPVPAAITGTNPIAVEVSAFSGDARTLVATAGAGAFTYAQLGAAVSGGSLTTTPYVLAKNAAASEVTIYPGAAPSEASPVTLTFTSYQMILGGHVKMYPTAIAGSTEQPDLSDVECRWVQRIAAARGMALNGDSSEDIAKIAGPIPEQYRKLAMTFARTQQPRVQSTDDALA